MPAGAPALKGPIGTPDEDPYATKIGVVNETVTLLHMTIADFKALDRAC